MLFKTIFVSSFAVLALAQDPAAAPTPIVDNAAGAAPDALASSLTSTSTLTQTMTSTSTSTCTVKYATTSAPAPVQDAATTSSSAVYANPTISPNNGTRPVTTQPVQPFPGAASSYAPQSILVSLVGASLAIFALS